MTPVAWAAFVVAAAVGAPARYLMDGFVQDRTAGVFPLGTFSVNVVGSFILGVLTGLASHHHLSAHTKTVLGTGFCGAFTTFSTFTFETVRLAEEGDVADAGRNVALSVLAGGAAAALGLALVSWTG